MKKTVLLSLGAVIGLGLAVYGGTDASAASNELYRVYNPNSGEHFYTESASEKDGLVAAGWTDEGIGWNTPTSGDTVYRVYNSNAGDHHYTKSVDEYNWLAAQGWTKEGTSFYSSTTEEVAIYRAYNPNAVVGSHNFTKSSDEQNWLVQDNGWTNEGIAFYGVNPTTDPEDPSTDVDKTALQERYDLVKDYTNLDFREPSKWTAFQTALANAAAVLADTNSDQATVDAAYLLLASTDTSIKAPLREALEAEAEKELVSTDYPGELWTAYQDALTAVKNGLNEVIGSAEITELTTNLNDAYTALEGKKFDKAGLQELVARIDEINPQAADFATDEAWADFETALATATERADVNNVEITQTDVNWSVNNLTDMYNALVYTKDVTALKAYVAGLSTEATDEVFVNANALAYFTAYATDVADYDVTLSNDNNAATIANWEQVFAGTYEAPAGGSITVPGSQILRDNTDRAAVKALFDGFVGKTPLKVAE
ncbi:hypothetical protein [Enterococcus sp. AZ103]|uniref:hypothetical protein n=1 Tax=Enterococcus sp. AZ103 TaxID=2774628 RepID=UPI003F21C4BC